MIGRIGVSSFRASSASVSRGASALTLSCIGTCFLGRIVRSKSPRIGCGILGASGVFRSFGRYGSVGGAFSRLSRCRRHRTWGLALPSRMGFCVRLKTQQFFPCFAPLSSSLRAGGSPSLASPAPRVCWGAVQPVHTAIGPWGARCLFSFQYVFVHLLLAHIGGHAKIGSSLPASCFGSSSPEGLLSFCGGPPPGFFGGGGVRARARRPLLDPGRARHQVRMCLFRGWLWHWEPRDPSCPDGEPGGVPRGSTGPQGLFFLLRSP